MVDVDSDLRLSCLALAVRPDQVGFVPSVQSSLELATRYPSARPMALIVGSDVAGFSMHGVDEATGLWKIFRLVVDARYQSQGVGRRAVRELIRMLVEEEGATAVLVSYQSDNEWARRLYAAEGFSEIKTEGRKVTARLHSVAQPGDAPDAASPAGDYLTVRRTGGR